MGQGVYGGSMKGVRKSKTGEGCRKRVKGEGKSSPQARRCFKSVPVLKAFCFFVAFVLFSGVLFYSLIEVFISAFLFSFLVASLSLSLFPNLA